MAFTTYSHLQEQCIYDLASLPGDTEYVAMYVYIHAYDLSLSLLT